MNILEYMVAFSLFCLLQAFAINGLFYAFKWETKNKTNGDIEISGNLLFPVAKWVGTRKSKFWKLISRPFSQCIRCAASLWGAVTFFPIVIWVFGFEWWEFGVYVFDVLILVSLNWLVYKKL